MIDKQGDQVHSINAEVQEVQRLPDEWLALSKAEKQRVLTILKGICTQKCQNNTSVFGGSVLPQIHKLIIFLI